ncbi:hypothetical protein B9G98_02242 [Wickerhamiella sorbophila]|uniref:RNA-binding protein VTS1 n=1 Tax=Wickerhamiella sorbophila TaxID=45607 RepID=A0A2T0FHZ6_9ASCO|nr:hypothetical protein B9G98_02242 [Wickerhamiella sorbophila]PRT54622.1 hypothetical protein B9G98_02242 [Wickerhamiella sorbophila]
MTPDPIESPLATRARVNEPGSHVHSHASGASHGAERVLLAALERSPLQREWQALEGWFQALDVVDQAAIAAALSRKVHPDFVPVIKACAGTESPYDAGFPAMAGPSAQDAGDIAAPACTTGSNSHRTEHFENFVDIARASGRQAVAPRQHSVDSAAGPSDNGSAGSSQNRFRTFRSLGTSQPPSAGASPFVNSFISPVPKSGLYSQAFAPLGQRQQSSFTPWSLSQEINRPKSATEINPSSSPNYSPYQSHPWAQPAGSASAGYGSSGLDIMRGGQSSGESKLQPVSKRWTASPLRPKTGLAGPAPGSAGSVSASTANPLGSPAPGAVGQGVAEVKNAAAGTIGPINPAPGPETPAGNRREDTKVWNGKPFQPTYAAAIGSSPAPATTAVSPPSVAAPPAAPASPRAANQSPYAKRSVNYMDIELLADMGAWLRSLRLHKYTENLSDMPWQEVVLLNDQDLEARGVNALGARRKMLKMFEEIRAAQDNGKLPK